MIRLAEILTSKDPFYAEMNNHREFNFAIISCVYVCVCGGGGGYLVFWI